MTDRAQNTLTFGHDGITHSSGKSVKFVRDGARIAGIYDPNGLTVTGETNGPAAIIYKYDARENLVAVQRLTDRQAEPPVYLRTAFSYTNVNHPNYLTSIEDPRGIVGVRTEYDEEGRVKSVIDATGKATTFTHDLNGKKEVIVDRLGNTNVLAYDARGNLIATTNAVGGIVLKGYDDNNKNTNEVVFLNGQPYATNNYEYVSNLLTLARNPLNHTERYQYNKFGQAEVFTDSRGFSSTNYYHPQTGDLLGTSDARGNATTNFYDSHGSILGSRDAGGTLSTNYYNNFGDLLATATYSLEGGFTLLSSNSFLYDANGNQTNSKASRKVGSGWVAATTTSVYDALNRVVQTIGPDGKTNSVIFSPLGKPALTTDKLGRPTQSEYDVQGQEFKTTFPDNTFELSYFDADGRLTNSVDRAGRNTIYQYDALDRMVSATAAKGTDDEAVGRNIYDDVGRIRFTVDARGVTNAFGYDAASRRVAETNAWGTIDQTFSLYEYDANDNLLRFTDALGRSTTNVYDELNQIIEVRHADGTKRFNVYDPDGFLVVETNEESVVTFYGYDDAGQLTVVTNAFGLPEQMITRFEYDEFGNLRRQIDALNRTNTFEYDDLSQRTKHVLPDGQWEAFAYDVVGNLLYHTNFNGVVITNKYDSVDQLTNRSSINGFKIAYSYTPTGQRQSMTDPGGATTYLYDDLDRLERKTVAWTGGPTISLDYRYNGNGGLTNMWSSSASGVNLIYQYDSQDRVTNVLANGNSAARYGFDVVGNLQSVRYGNGVTNLYQYNKLNRLTNMVWKLNAGSLASFDYQLGLPGNRTNLNESVNGTGRNYGWAYDPLYRLKKETISGGSSGTVDYGFDRVGNRTNRTVTGSLGSLANQSFAYRSNDWLRTDAYDNNGNTLWSTNAVGGTIGPYFYDVDNQLTNYNNAVYFAYDGDGNRVRKTVGTTTTYFLVDDQNLTGYAQVLEEHESISGQSATLSRVYNYGLDLVSQRQMPSGTTHFYGHDGQGSVRFLTSDLGAVTDTYTYDGGGSLIARTPTSGWTPNNYLYAGEQYDVDLGFYYLRARYLNPNTGRFWTMDSFEGEEDEPLSLHKYLYAHGDPVNNIDPSGHESLIGIAVAGAIGQALQTVYDGVVSTTGDAVMDVLLEYLKSQIAEEFFFEGLDNDDPAFLDDPVKWTAEKMIRNGWGKEEAYTYAYRVYFYFAVEPIFNPQPNLLEEYQTDIQCFTAGTLVQTVNGPRNIEDVRTGDFVWAYDTVTMQTVAKAVTQTMVRHRDDVFLVTTDDGEVEATAEHPFFVPDRGWINTEDLRSGDALFRGEEEEPTIVTSVVRQPGNFPVYNFEVDGLHNYFVTDQGILVHNFKGRRQFNHWFPRQAGSLIRYGSSILRKAPAITRKVHKGFHADYRKFMRSKKKNGVGDLDARVGNNTAKIVKKFPLNQRVKAVRKFYKTHPKWKKYKKYMEQELKYAKKNKQIQ